MPFAFFFNNDDDDDEDDDEDIWDELESIHLFFLRGRLGSVRLGCAKIVTSPFRHLPELGKASRITGSESNSVRKDGRIEVGVLRFMMVLLRL